MILVPDNIRQPVDFVRLLTRNGLSLRKAHDLLNRLAAGETVALEMHTNDRIKLSSELSQAGVKVGFINPPDANPKNVRERFGLSQAEFAIRYGFEVDTLQNWEQGLNTPNAPMRLLLKIIETHPEAVEQLLTRQSLVQAHWQEALEPTLGSAVSYEHRLEATKAAERGRPGMRGERRGFATVLSTSITPTGYAWTVRPVGMAGRNEKFAAY